MRRTVVFVDFNSYFAAVEQHADPRLRGKPIAVIPTKAETTCCIAASREAKRFGVKTGTGVREARAMCPGIIFITSDGARYMDYHRRLVSLVEEEIPVEKVCSVDELYGVFNGPFAEKEKVWEIAVKLKQRLAKDFGGPLTCSIGLSSTVFLAKTASDMQKPDGLVWLDAEQPGPEFFALELRDLCGIGRNMHDRLQSRGIFTVRGLWEASPKRLGKVWGGIEGERFWQGLHGIEPVRPETTPRQVGHSKILPPELRNENGSRAMLDRLVYKAVMRLRRQGHECGEMRIYVRMSHHGGISWSGVARFPSTQEVLPLMEVWRELWQERPSPLSCPFMVGVDLTMLLPHDDPRLPLFAPCARDQAVSCLLEEIARKHGAKSLWFGSAHEAVAEDAPRVAFFTLPDT